MRHTKDESGNRTYRTETETKIISIVELDSGKYSAVVHNKSEAYFSYSHGHENTTQALKEAKDRI